MKKVLIIILITILVSLLGIYSLMTRNKKPVSNIPQPPEPTSYATPTLYQVFPSSKPNDVNPIGVKSTIPKDRSINVPLTSNIVITFNTTIVKDDITFFTVPEAPYTMSANGNDLIITFNEPLLPGTTYSYAISYKNKSIIPLTYSFTTSGPSPTNLPNTRDAEFFRERSEYERTNNPDVYLAAFVPYYADTFSITRERVYDSNHYYQFTVILKNKETGKRELITWMKSLQLTDSQIQSLDIVYK